MATEAELRYSSVALARAGSTALIKLSQELQVPEAAGNQRWAQPQERVIHFQLSCKL